MSKNDAASLMLYEDNEFVSRLIWCLFSKYDDAYFQSMMMLQSGDLVCVCDQKTTYVTRYKF